jgi:hypothetical protein
MGNWLAHAAPFWQLNIARQNRQTLLLSAMVFGSNLIYYSGLTACVLLWWCSFRPSTIAYKTQVILSAAEGGVEESGLRTLLTLRSVVRHGLQWEGRVRFFAPMIIGHQVSSIENRESYILLLASYFLPLTSQHNQRNLSVVSCFVAPKERSSKLYAKEDLRLKITQDARHVWKSSF